MDERGKRDAEINAAFKGIESLINPTSNQQSITEDDQNDDSIDELVALVGDVQVKKNIHINDRVEFAAQIEEIESKGITLLLFFWSKFKNHVIYKSHKNFY